MMNENMNNGGYYPSMQNYYYPNYMNTNNMLPQQYQQPQPQVQTQPRYLMGRFVNTAQDIRAAEVPMDGSVGLFPQYDGSCIYSKSWKADGTINTITYVPMQETAAQSAELSATEKFNQEVLARLEKIEKALDRKGNKKKGATNDESTTVCNESNQQ